MTKRVEFSEGMLAMVKAIDKYMGGSGTLEFGYRPLPDGSEPKAGDRVTCYATYTYTDGTVIEREASSHLVPKAMADAVSDVARSLGMRVRLAYDYSDYTKGLVEQDE